MIENPKQIAAYAAEIWQEILFRFPNGPSAEMMETLSALHALICRESALFLVNSGAPKEIASIDLIHKALQSNQSRYIKLYKEMLP